MKKSNEAEIM